MNGSELANGLAAGIFARLALAVTVIVVLSACGGILLGSWASDLQRQADERDQRIEAEAK